MARISFESDYIQGCHEKILEALVKTNMEMLSGYGDDCYCHSAKEKIREAIGQHDSEVFFLSGGTQTNQIVIDTMLDSSEGVISANTGHINCHEAGAIEYTGRKILSLPQYLGKIDINDLKSLVIGFENDKNNAHMVAPRLLYISHPTEYGTLYSLEELSEISDFCHAHGIGLYLDGARLGYGLASYSTDVTIKDVARLCDAFYIGGTKVGALIGEAVVFKKDSLPKAFFTKIKQHGALLAKGRLLGIQFDTLFTDDLYFKISRHAIEMAELLKKVFIKHGFELYMDSPTNQIFVILDNSVYDILLEKVGFCYWEPFDADRTVVRFATSWATSENDINTLDEILGNL
ncbi:MAG: aminotransferase class V-fold PLP-dependent enzyme [Ruminococcaceae bacterium]|nr:aminotransferase class V-fold PLP-dependent enzyme [Oscillospiraceae bacterium]